MTYRVEALNTATASENKIHDDAVARRFGFEGGLVPGVDVFAYLTHPVVERWGLDWFRGGGIEARFASPVFDGESVSVETEMTDELRMALRVVGPDGTGRAAGHASPPPGRPDGAHRPTIPSAPLPDPPPPASFGVLGTGTVLGTLETGFHADRAEEYLADVREELALYREERIAHPGWLLRMANYVLAVNVELGPWIHTSSAVTMRRPVHDGEAIETRARVHETFERGGHEFVRLDVEMIVGAEVVMLVDHTAIFRPRQVKQG